MTRSGKKFKTSPSLYIVDLIGSASICTRSISSLYLGCGERYNLCNAVPPLKASLEAKKSSLKMATNARLIIRSCSTCSFAFHGTCVLHCIIAALFIIVRLFLYQYLYLFSNVYSHPSKFEDGVNSKVYNSNVYHKSVTVHIVYLPVLIH